MDSFLHVVMHLFETKLLHRSVLIPLEVDGPEVNPKLSPIFNHLSVVVESLLIRNASGGLLMVEVPQVHGLSEHLEAVVNELVEHTVSENALRDIVVAVVVIVIIDLVVSTVVQVLEDLVEEVVGGGLDFLVRDAPDVYVLELVEGGDHV